MFPAAVLSPRLVMSEDGSGGVVAQHVRFADVDGFHPITRRVDNARRRDDLYFGLWLNRGTTGRATAQQQNR